jgi:hypothetical protein
MILCVVAYVLVYDHNVRLHVGRRRPLVWGLMWGFVRGRTPSRQRPCQDAKEYRGIEQSEAGACSGNAIARLVQVQLCCPFDGRPAIIDVELPVDALGMGADGTQGDHELTGDLRPRKLGFEQSEHVTLALA